MSRTHAAGLISAIAVLSILLPVSLSAQFIDFETLPGGGATVDLQFISTEYASLGVTFTLLDRVTGLPIGSPRIAKAGSPLTAFEGCLAADTPYAHYGLGQSFLTDGTGLGVDGDLLIEYATPVAAASGLILDIDCRTNGGPPCEQWTITAFDTNGAVLDSVVLDAPAGAPNPGCATPEAGPGDSEAFGWSFNIGSPMIGSIVLRYTGTAPNVGLAFDNFSVSTEPLPLDLTASASTDTVCIGETITLSAFATGGFPPYTFQWQQEVNPVTWLDLGTAATQAIVSSGTTRYRVTVTDVTAALVTSADIVVVASTSFLCDASLIVSSNINNRVVRYSFLSQQPEVFVPSGSGGLNSTSDVVCGPDGNLYVSSQANHRVLRYDGVTGAFIDVFVAGGSGGLNLPVGLDFGPDGNLYVVSNGNHSVLRYDASTGAFIDTFVPNGSGLNSPTGMVFGPDSHMYVCSRNSDKVLRFDGTTGAAMGDFVTTGSGGLDAPRGLTFGPDGNLYIGEEISDSVRRYDGTTGAFIDIFVSGGSGGLDRANDVEFGLDGVLYVASFNNNLVLGYNGTTGAFIGALPDGVLNGPAWLAVGCHPTATAVRNTPKTPQLALSLDPNVPNPFNPWTRATFTLSAAGDARVTVVDVAGRVVATLLDRPLTAGRHTVEWKGSTVSGGTAPSGIYFLRVESGGRSAVRKITLVR